MTLVELIKWLAAAGPALGVVSSLVVQILKKFWPQIEGDLAQYISITVAVLIAALAQAAEPYIGEIPPVVNQYWWVVVVLWQHVIYHWLTKAEVGIWKKPQ